MEVTDLIRQKPSSPFDEYEQSSTRQKCAKSIGFVSVPTKGLMGMQQLLENVQDSGYLHRLLPKTITIGKENCILAVLGGFRALKLRNAFKNASCSLF